MPWYNVGDVGKRVSASLSDGGKIEGWLYGEIPQGILIAEDTEGSRLRLLQKGSWTSMGYPNAPRASFTPANLDQINEQVNDLNKKLQPRMEIALNKLDLRPLQRFFSRAPDLYRSIDRMQYDVPRLISTDSEDNPNDEVAYFLAARTGEVVEMHSEVFNELEQSGIADIVSEHARELNSLPPKYTLPSVSSSLILR